MQQTISSPCASRNCQRPILVWIILVLYSVMCFPLQAREFPAFYERDYETASKLNELHEKLEAADTLFMLDSTNNAIVAGACQSQDLAYQRAYDGLSELASRRTASGALSTADRERYQKLQRVEEENWRRFEDCFDEQIRRPGFANVLPPGVNSYASATAVYDRTLQDYPGEFTEGQIQANIAKIEAEIRHLESADNYIGRVTSVMGKAQLRRVGVAAPQILREGTELLAGDTLLTESRGRIILELYDRIEAKNAGPTVINVGSDTEVRIERVFFRRWAEQQRRANSNHYDLAREAMVNTIRGTIRAFTKGFTGQAAFNVRTGTSLCGIRGTDVEIFYDPAADVVDYKLYEGVVEIRTPSQTVNLKAGNGLRVRDGAPSPPRTLEHSQS
ncbi:FecR domain-containing protein [Parahaliea maris]|uniref:FecR domain-containing protein n=1 Tax=Parahaliea maris TaxID=2716870 RepID=A0A5C9A6P7_9GAMM|nr:FecR domain-containing protein [Parahaliea maris]TXS96643.1 FecR domain-containing protein [Parahaliea maris]